MANEINQVKVGSTTYTLQDSRVDSLVTGVSSVNSKTGDVSLGASDVGALSLDGGTINKSKTVKMDASANSNGANLKWGTVNSKNPYIGYASDQSDGTFVIGSLTGTNYASGLAIGGGSGNLLWKGTKVATTSDIPSVPTVNNATLTIQKNGTNVATFTSNASSNATANITVPTKVSELTNDSEFITSNDSVKSVIDYGNTSQNIKIGYSGAGISGDSIKYIAGYTTGDSESAMRIKDISKDALKDWLGNATTSAAGLMSAADKTKLDSTFGANAITDFNMSSGTTTAAEINTNGIKCATDELEIEFNGGTDYNYCVGNFTVPIVAGSNTSITKNDSNRAEIEFMPPPWNVSNASFGIANYGNGLYEFRINVTTKEGNSGSNITNNLSTFVYWEEGSYSQSPACTAKNSSGTITQYSIFIGTAGGVTLYQVSGTSITIPLSRTIYYRKIANA